MEDVLSEVYGHSFDLQNDIVATARRLDLGSAKADVSRVTAMIEGLRQTGPFPESKQKGAGGIQRLREGLNK